MVLLLAMARIDHRPLAQVLEWALRLVLEWVLRLGIELLEGQEGQSQV
jgi:hypothetical protein